MRIKFIITVMVLVLIMIGSGCRTAGRSTSFREDSSSSSPASSSAEVESGRVCVYVCGEVNAPGVYELSRGSRVKDAIRLAGGLSADADMNAVNQALLVKDQDKIVVPAKGAVSSDGTTGQGALLDINRATKEQLMTLPGIGESKANAIISYREKTGGFKSLDDLLKIEGIKSGVFNKIKDSISVG